jgi:hypothetical protein
MDCPCRFKRERDQGSYERMTATAFGAAEEEL